MQITDLTAGQLKELARFRLENERRQGYSTGKRPKIQFVGMSLANKNVLLRATLQPNDEINIAFSPIAELYHANEISLLKEFGVTEY